MDYFASKKLVGSFSKKMILILFFILPSIRSQNCTAGQYLSNGQCYRCSTGYYCPDGIRNITCPPGEYTDLYQQTSCRVCRAGWYTIQNSSNTCWKCPLGFYCADSSKLPVPCPPGFHADLYAQTTCRPCAAGTYTIQNGSIYCTKCPIGNFCPTASKLPALCPISYYNGLYMQIACRQCQKNSTTIAVGQSICTPFQANSCSAICTLVC